MSTTDTVAHKDTKDYWIEKAAEVFKVAYEEVTPIMRKAVKAIECENNISKGGK